MEHILLAKISSHHHVVSVEEHKKEQQALALPLPPNRALGVLKQGTVSQQTCIPHRSNSALGTEQLRGLKGAR